MVDILGVVESDGFLRDRVNRGGCSFSPGVVEKRMREREG